MRYLTAIVGILLIAGLSFLPSATRGATIPGEVIITWAANNFYPSDYEGKALPVGGTTVSASLEVVRGGKLQDIKNVPITWYLDGEYLVRGTGLKRTTFTVTKGKGDTHSLRAAAGLPEGGVEGTALVPVASRTVVIETPYRNLAAPHGARLVLHAVPYFFNITSLADLLFSWTAGENAESASGDNELSINLGDTQGQGTLPVSVAVRGIRSPFEFASDAIKITINP